MNPTYPHIQGQLYQHTSCRGKTLITENTANVAMVTNNIPTVGMQTIQVENNKFPKNKLFSLYLSVNNCLSQQIVQDSNVKFQNICMESSILNVKFICQYTKCVFPDGDISISMQNFYIITLEKIREMFYIVFILT